MQIDEMRGSRSVHEAILASCKPQIMPLFATSLLILGCSCFASATAPGAWNAVREVTDL